jgi:hypothetical protein
MMKLSVKQYFWIGCISILLAWGAFVGIAFAIAAFSPADQPVGHVSQDAMTNYDLRSGNETLFRGEYEKEFWGGNLLAYQINDQGDVSTSLVAWRAATKLDEQGAARKIVTLKSDGTKIPFTWATLSGAQQGNLTSPAVLDYLRGVRTGEIQQGGTMRQRASALGDIIHSRPNYVADTTNPTVFVGANDGMLHAFDAVSGTERWAYVPSMLIPKMKNLTVFPYVHDYYVDGSINVATILSGSKRILVGALGAGGKGLYALDITGSARLAPADEAAAATNALWEITPSTINNAANTSYGNLGYSAGLASIVKVAGVDAVVVGNGYNDGGDYQAYLYIINANTGALISAIQAGTSGTASSPNGLSTPVVIDSNGDGTVDTVYAGDLNGTMWKFDVAAGTSSVLLTTSPAQPITMTPGVAAHPSGGIMVNFATGAMLKATDTTDTSVFAAYGIWDGAPVANTTLLTQTLTERCYTSGTSVASSPCASRTRTVTANAPNWASGGHKGWKVALPAGEKVVGDGSFIENGRFYFTAHNPTISTAVQSSTVKGENWLMELDYLSGGAKNSPFLDLSGDHVLDNDDRIKTGSPAVPDVTTNGISVGKFLKIGVMSQPILVQLSSLNNTLFNQNPDVVVVPVALETGSGVTGGHFDVDIFYAPPISGTQSRATITVGTTGQTSGFPATLGAISVDGVVIVPALTVSDLPDGTASSTNANVIKSKITNGFTATRSGSVVTVYAPVGTQYNGKTITIAPGTSQTLVSAVAYVAPVTAVASVAAVRPTGFVTFSGNSGAGNNYTINDNVSGGGSQSVKVDGNNAYGNDIVIGANKTAVQAAAAFVSAMGTGGTYKAYVGGNTITSACGAKATNVVCIIDTSSNNNGANNGRAIALGSVSNAGGLSFTTTATAGGVTAVAGVAAVAEVQAVAKSGWTNFAPALTTSTFNNTGTEAASVGDACTGASDSLCRYDQHIHQYDDEYDVTGVNILNPSDVKLDVKRAIPSLVQDFKVLVQNQYLNPAIKLHIGDPTYLFNVDFGYLSLKNYVTSATLDLADLQTYRRDPSAVWPGAAITTAEKLAQPKPIGSFAFNMPLDALTAKNWWNNGDVRVGLHPTIYRCAWAAAGSKDGNTYQPVVPPVNGVDGPGSAGWSSSTTPATATGARHNGALVIQLIRANTPNSAIEQNIPGRPEYGWRVKSASFSDYVLVEYAAYWHHPNGKCYHEASWTKTPGADTGTSTPSTKAPGSTDPKIGDLSAGGVGDVTVTQVTTTTVGDVTTTVIKYSDGREARIERTANRDGSVTIRTTDASGNTTSQTIANRDGSLTSGGDERGLQPRTGRISWRELVKQ